jgi:thiamine-phosphate pyrophosphorylase
MLCVVDHLAAIGSAMRKRHSLPKIWLMTDERLGDGLLPAIRALPKGSGIIFRHYGLEPTARQALFDAVRIIARRNRHLLLLAGGEHGWGEAGRHGRTQKRTAAIQSAPAHSVQERLAAERAGADLMFVSPIFTTRSHPGAGGLGRVRFGLMIRGAKCPVIALGGMDAKRARSLKPLGIYGWAAISSLARSNWPTS